MSKIIGRHREINILNEIVNRNTAQLVVVYGRRRVGKTFIVNEYFENNFAFKITGLNNHATKVQLQLFCTELIKRGVEIMEPIKNWFVAFTYLREYIERLDKEKKQVVFFDEMPWLDTRKSDFKGAFENFWNDYASTKDNLVFIVCGSSSSWMVNNIVNNKGGLFNRHTARIYIEPFKLYEVEEFLLSKNIKWSRYDVVQCYMILGGIPYYLNLLSSSKTLNENIDEMFFVNGALLWDEYDKLYSTLFNNQIIYKKIVEELYSKKTLTRNEIANQVKTPNNGVLTKMLEDLLYSGFIKIRQTEGEKKERSYYLCDYFSLFYLKFVKNKIGRDEKYWENSYSDQSRLVWGGITFEYVCFDHIKEIKKVLGIEGVLSSEYSYRYISSNDDRGCQIDLVIDRKDHVVSLCEIKYSINEYNISKDYYLNIQNKISQFIGKAGRHNTIQLVFITTFGLAKNEYSNSVNRQIVIDDLFNQVD